MSYPCISLLLTLTLNLAQALSSPSFSEPRLLGETSLISVTEGLWGDWKIDYKVPDGTLACGIQLQIEPPQPNGGDDTAANGVRIIYCKVGDWNNYSYIQLNEGQWGTWEEKMCPKDYYIYGIIARFENALGGKGDDTALNSLSFKCKNPINGNSGSTMTIEKTNWGSWLSWVEDSNKYICGGQVRVEGDQGSGDDTALNGLRVKFCSYSS